MKGIWGVIEFLEDDEYFDDICFDTRLSRQYSSFCKMILYVDIEHMYSKTSSKADSALVPGSKGYRLTAVHVHRHPMPGGK